MRLRLTVPLLLVGCLAMGGCMQVFGLASVMGQSFEYQKLIEVPAEYSGLQNQRVAIVVDADLSLLYQYPTLVQTVSYNVAARVAQNVEGAQVTNPQFIAQWQYQTPQWNAMPYGQIMDELQVDRLVYVDVYEYRLNPPGNSWMWEGAAAADVGVAERDNFDPDTFVDVFPIEVSFPDVQGLTREEANAGQIETGLMTRFLQKTAYLFYLHTEPKYPDKYNPALDPA